MKKFSIGSLAALVLLGLHPGMGQAASTGPRTFRVRPQIIHSASWVDTATKSLMPALNNAIDTGPLAPSTPLRIVVGLKMRDLAGAQTLLAREHTPSDSMYENTVSPAQFTAAFNPTRQQVNAVVAYLMGQGFTNVSAEPNNLLVTGNATAAQASAAFNTQIDTFLQAGKTFYGEVSTAQVPVSLGGTVAAVLGLNNIQMRPLARRASRSAAAAGPPDACVGPPIAPSNACIRSYNAHDFQAAYGGLKINNNANKFDGTNSTTGFRDSMAVFAQGNLAQVLPDLRKYESVNGLPQIAYSVVPVGIFSPDTAGLIEWDLDSQTSTGIAQYVKHLYMYDTTSLTDSDTGLEFNRFVTQNVANEGNASFGECEVFPYLDGAMVVDDQIFLQGAAQGQTVFVSSGDNGSGCPVLLSTGVPASGPFEASYPASSPYVVAVGGTTLLSDANDKSYGGEKAWEGSGGGPSQFENEPYWQKGIGNPVADAAGLRQVPDVALDADPNTGAIIYSNNMQQFVGGTSLSSPLTMGIWSRLMTSHHNEFGFASPLFYFEYKLFPAPTPPAVPTGPPGFETSMVGGFHDIYVGFNGAFTALPRYDFVTGLGTQDIGKQSKFVDDICDNDSDDLPNCIKVR